MDLRYEIDSMTAPLARLVDIPVKPVAETLQDPYQSSAADEVFPQVTRLKRLTRFFELVVARPGVSTNLPGQEPLNDTAITIRPVNPAVSNQNIEWETVEPIKSPIVAPTNVEPKTYQFVVPSDDYVIERQNLRRYVLKPLFPYEEA